MSTHCVKAKEIDRKWWIIDATDLVLGRLAVEAARILRGKHKASFSPHLDCGDNLIIINADKLHVTGKKAEQKKYYWHTGHPGGVKEKTAGDIISGQFPERLLKKAIERMISRNPLGRAQMRKLHIYAGADHPHVAQQPQALDFAAKNPKNKKRKKV